MSALDDFVIYHVNNCSSSDQKAAILELMELYKENADHVVLLAECRELLIEMVNQYCRNSSGEPTTYSHDFMSTGEAVFSYLVKHGLAEWDKNGIDIRIKQK